MWTLLPILVLCLLGIHSGRAAISRQEVECITNCDKNISSLVACGGNITCFCNIDYTTIIQYEKCTYDCTTPEDWQDVPTNETSPTEQCDGATTMPPHGTRTSQFDLIGCASGCLSTANIPGCSDFPSTECMCGILAAPTNETISSVFRFNKCAVDACNEHDAAIAITQLDVQCGTYPASTAPSDLKWPYNRFKIVYDASISSATLTSPGAISLLAGAMLAVLMI